MTHDISVIPSVPTDNFSVERWNQLTQSLRVCENLFRRLAAEAGLQLVGSSRWPEIGLRRKSLLLMHEARLALVAEESDNRGPEWVVRVVHYARFPPIMSKRGSVEEIARLTDKSLRSDIGHVERSMTAALRRVL